MKALRRNLLLGVFAVTLAAYGTTMASAAPPPHFPPHFPHYGPGPWIPGYPTPVKPWYKPYHPWPRLVVVVPPRPYILAANVAPAACIRLVNPIENRSALRYTVNGGVVRVLPAGLSVCFDREVVIRFDRGGGQGLARYLLQDGSLPFRSGRWLLVLDPR